MKRKLLLRLIVGTLTLTAGLVGCSDLKPVENLTQPTTVTLHPTEAPTLAATLPQEDVLPFETVERLVWSGSGGEWEAMESGLMVMATPKDMVQMDDLFTEDAQARLRKVDFNTYFSIAVFLGWQSDGHEGLDIRQIIRQGDEIVIYVRVGNPGGTLGVTSPYHLVSVRKEGNWNQTIHFTLYMDGAETTSLSHFIP